MLTNSELNQIKNFLALYGKKDSQLSLITEEELSKDETTVYLSIVQDNKNYRITLDLLRKAVLEGLIDDDIYGIIDNQPVSGSRNLVRSGGVYNAINDPKVIHESQVDDDAVSTRTIQNDAVVTAKIADSNVTEDKLSNEVKSSISKYTHSISATGTGVREIGQDSLTSTITITNKIAYYGDRMDDLVTPSSQNIRKRVSEDTVNEQYTSWTLNPSVGNHTLYYTSTYNEISPAEVSVTIPLNLRKYFGYVPDDVIDQGKEAILSYLIQHDGDGDVAVSDFSNIVGCTVNIPANGEGKKYAYFAVPKPMVISSVIQTASQLVFPLDTPVDATRTITIERVDNYFPYRLYKSTEKPDSDRSKQVKIS